MNHRRKRKPSAGSLKEFFQVSLTLGLDGGTAPPQEIICIDWQEAAADSAHSIQISMTSQQERRGRALCHGVKS